ncbi:MAG: peptidoglycan-binding protein [Bryobacterales bacterium]|nr:peptidoglycan-binding protein [Bryobacterales bacterium]
MKAGFTIQRRGAARRPFVICLILLLGILPAAPLPAETAAAKKPAARKTAGKSAAARKGTASKKRATAKSRRTRRTARTTWRNRQAAPTPERYREIQQALIEKGYFGEPATGVWGESSVEALKRFQREHDLEPTGKIDSLSLIALGLGPKYETHTSNSTPRAGPPPGSNPD